MAVQVRADLTTEPFILSGQSFVKNSIIVTDGARATVLKKNTVLARIGSTRKYTPFVSLTTTTGASVPSAIYIGDDIPAADLVSGDVVDVPVLVGGGCTVNEDLVVFDANTLSADSIVNAAAANPYFVITARDCLGMFGIYLEDTEAISEHEN